MSLLDELKEAYLDYAETHTFKNRINKSKDLIKKILAEHNNPYIACSSGKDSLTLLHIILSVKKIDVMFHDSGVELPESYKCIIKLKKDFNLNICTVNSPVDVLKIYKEKDAFITGSSQDIAFTEAMSKPIKEWILKNNYNLSFIGLRKQESKRRQIMLCKNGYYHYCKSYKIHQCYPLADWKKEDIFAYLFKNNLGDYIHPAYYKDKFVDDPGDIRVSWFCDPAMATQGQFLWLKYYYKNIFDQLKKMFPEILSFV